MRANVSAVILLVAAMLGAASAEEPVYFADANLKAAIEQALDVTDPTATDMLALKSLHIGRREISNLTGLEFAVNLWSLEITRSQISDISPLAGLTNLEFLSLWDNQVSDILSISALTKLKTLELESNSIEDVTVLFELKSLQRLSLGYNQVGDILPLAGITSLRELYLAGNKINDISALSGLTGLQRVNLSGNPIGDISPLSQLTDVISLGLQGNQVNDISVLSGLVRLRWLFLGNNQIRDLSPLSDLLNLESLWLFGNELSDISPLSSLKKMKMLYVDDNQIIDFSPICGLTSLNRLRLSNNPSVDLSLLSELTDLQYLYLQRLQISDISPLSGLTNLLELNLGNNEISDVSPLSGLVSLQELWLGSNHISDVSPLSGLTNLRWLMFGYNEVSDISSLIGLVNLETLQLTENPLDPNAYTIHIPLFEAYGTTVRYTPPASWPKLTINSTAGGSVIEPGEGNFGYMYRTVVDISAVAAAGYRFAYWSGTPLSAGEITNPAAADTSVIVRADCMLRANFEPSEAALCVDDDAANDPGPNNPEVSDRGEDGSPEHPYDTIQEAIDAAEYGEVVLVYPGLYQEGFDFLGKAITVQGVATADGIAVLENPGGFSATFSHGERSTSVLKNFVMRNNAMAIFIAGSAPTIKNVAFVGNEYAVGAYNGAEPDISNSIFWGNIYGNLYQCQARYSCLEGPGEGNIDADPLFADPDDGDYHLLSSHGRYWPEQGVWIVDEVTSPCVDGGDPTAALSDEPIPNGGRINMGAYGGTTYASKSG